MNKSPNYYIVGGGIAGLSAAVYLIEDGKIDGKQIVILDKAKRFGGALDAKKTKENVGYTMRGIRVFEDRAYTCFMDLVSRVPSLKEKDKTLKDEILEFNNLKKVYFKGRLTKNKKIIDSKGFKISLKDRIKLVKLLFTKEEKINNIKIKEYFSKEFFESNFWYEFSTVFAFVPHHSLNEMKRYILRSIHCSQYFDTLEPLKITPLNQYESLILPIIEYLEKNGVKFENETKILNIDFENIDDKKRVKKIYTTKNNKPKEISLRENDYAFISLGSMVSNSSIGSMEKQAKEKLQKESLSWQLWENIAKDNKEFGNPRAFINNSLKSGWTSFTITFKDSFIRDLIKDYIKDENTAFAGTTIVDSNWFISIGFHLDKYFENQDEDTLITWGDVLFPHEEGNYIKKKIEYCSGKEILTELVYHLGLEEHLDKILETSICIPSRTPYVTSQFMPTNKGDRPEVVPESSLNFAFLGQFAEVKGGIVFTMEYSVRTAQKAVYEILKLNNKVKPIYKGYLIPKNMFNILKTIFR